MRSANPISASAIVLTLMVCAASVLAASGQLQGNWLAIVGVGTLLAIYGLIKLRSLARAAGWERVRATVLAREVVEVWTPGYARHRPMLAFEAFIGGKAVRSTRLSMDDEDFEGERAEAEALLQDYAPGTDFEAFVDPQRGRLPVARVEVPVRRRSHYRNCVIAGICLVIVAMDAGGMLAP